MGLITKYVYGLFRYSAVYPWYLKIFRPTIFAEYKKGRNFYKSLLEKHKPIVFDIGANVGDKSAIFCKYSTLVVAVEPDKTNNNLLHKRFFLEPKVKVVHAAVSNKQGKELFYENSPGSPANTLSSKWKGILENPHANRFSKALTFPASYEVDTTTLDSLIQAHGIPYYIKIDVEGYENLVLESLSKPVSIISFEVNFPDFIDETLQCVQYLTRLSSNTKFNAMDDRYEFFWTEHKDSQFILDWLAKTELRYFEMYCFSMSESSVFQEKQ